MSRQLNAAPESEGWSARMRTKASTIVRKLCVARCLIEASAVLYVKTQ